VKFRIPGKTCKETQFHMAIHYPTVFILEIFARSQMHYKTHKTIKDDTKLLKKILIVLSVIYFTYLIILTNSVEITMSKSKRFNFFTQYYAGVFANFLTITYGVTLGWTSPTIPILESELSPLESGPATVEQISWIASSLSPGGILATLTYGFVSNFLGRKLALLLVAAPQLVLDFLGIFLKHFEDFYSIRL
jgi:hypothetical protein